MIISKRARLWAPLLLSSKSWRLCTHVIKPHQPPAPIGDSRRRLAGGVVPGSELSLVPPGVYGRSFSALKTRFAPF
jgi:hypothetical protein